MKLHELHVDELGARSVRDRMAVARALPAVAGDLVRASDAAGREHDRPGDEHVKAPTLAVVRERARHLAATVEQQIDDRLLHVHGHAQVHRVVLQRADQLEAGAVADVCQAWIAMPAEVALQDTAVGRAIEHGAPSLQLAHAIGRLLGVDLGHAPVVDVLTAAHRVREVHLPVVPVVDVGERGRHPAFGHHRVRLAQQRLADEADRHAG